MEGGGGGGGGQGEQGHHAEEPQGRHTQGRRENSYMYTHVCFHIGFHLGGGGGTFSPPWEFGYPKIFLVSNLIHAPPPQVLNVQLFPPLDN